MENVAEPVVLAGTPAPEKEKGLTGSTLKIIAIVTMFIDHAGAVLVERYLDSKGADLIPQVGQMDEETKRLALVSLLDFFMRMIGRMAFPIFIFLLVQGFMYTHSRAKYVFRLALFALIAELPFNLAFKGSLFTTSYQNVFFTITLGFLFLWFTEDLAFKCPLKMWHGLICLVASSAALAFWAIGDVTAQFGVNLGRFTLKRMIPSAVGAIIIIAVLLIVYGVKKDLDRLWKISLSLVGLSVLIYIADFLRTDYGGLGVLAIATCYAFRKKNMLAFGLTCGVLSIFNLMEIFSFIAMVFVAFYNGKRGLKAKYFFYVFYPTHLFILHILSWILGFYQGSPFGF